MRLESKSPLINEALFKFWFAPDCAVYQQAAVRLTVSSKTLFLCKMLENVVSVYTVFMHSKFTVQLTCNVIPDLSHTNNFPS